MRVLDLFSGIGAMSLGLEWAGMQTVGFCEIEPACRFWLREHWREQPIFEDIRTLTGGEIAERCGAVDLVAGGFPCQDISSAGKGAGITGERSGLWFEMLRIVREVRPDWVLAENVPALRTRGADVVLEGLGAEGYSCWPLVVGADDAGAPHRRKRIWIVAHRNGEGLGEFGRAPVEREEWMHADDSSSARMANADRDCGRADRRGSDTGSDGRDDASGRGASLCGPLVDADNESGANESRRWIWKGRTGTVPAIASVADAQRDGLEGRREFTISASAQEPRLAGRYDATRERGWPSRPGEPQRGWEAPRLADSARDGQRAWSEWPDRERTRACGDAGMADSEHTQRQSSQRRRRKQSSSDAGAGSGNTWISKPGMGGATDGAARRLARLESARRRARLRAIGNTVCPQVVEAVGRAIMVANANS
jgi:DNA (cytosine-5)-methyltransferase 1